MSDVEGAIAQARDAATAAGVAVRPLTLEECGTAAALLAGLWGVPPVGLPVLVALHHTGHYVAGAFVGADLVGVCVGIVSPGDVGLHSHVTGVLPELAGHGVGAAIKLHQRAWCLERGIETIRWTFDPLVAGNAWFNFGRLGVTLERYVVDFYGETRGGTRPELGRDRVLVAWDLTRARGPVAVSGEELPLLLAADADGRPQVRTAPPDVPEAAIAVPRHIERIREEDPELRLAWRVALRETLTAALADGWRVTGFSRDGRYLLARDS
ncbi:hypothetical protein QQX10_03305 [Demequina sp. SYSU T00039]|uniref:GNAT superfamily acetyltransferase n=1 Tax=Demequina lignilytica TaxID=3051663 RepID=A0AAW7M731_9MICO|nr:MULTISPECIES: hypothetical protein [unclassified Demequina]MDN4477015.1 hypothetical protein [Demequina sp. SYSU T00039-1]MDN4487188.1 hypothetical protein [Demequina sp. SYSU T00039]